MKCPKCSHLNEDEARYCNNCGFPLMEKKKDWTSILLLAWCVSLLFFTFVWTIYDYVIYPWVHTTYDYTTAPKITHTILFVISSIQTLTNLVIPFAIPKIGLKIAAFVVIGVFIIVSITRSFFSLMSTYSIF